jgi:PhnB protein
LGTPAKRYIPEGYHTVLPYLIVKGAAKALDFYKRAFNATELVRLPMPDGRVGHAEFRIGNSVVMLADEMPDMKVLGPESVGGTTVGFCIYVEDCDAVFKQAIAAGARQDRPLENQFYGDRSGTLIDPFGHKWTVATHKEDISPEEMKQRMAQQKWGAANG